MTEQVLKSPINIITTMKEKLSGYQEAQLTFKSKMDGIHALFKNGEFGDVTENTLRQGIESTKKLRKQRVDIYLINYAKINLSNEATEVINEYRSWKKYKTEIEEIQKGLLDLIYIDEEIIKILAECIQLLNNQQNNEVTQ